MNRLRWALYRRCGCRVCLRWRHRAALGCWWASGTCAWFAAGFLGSGFGFTADVFGVAIGLGAVGAVLGAWPQVSHGPDDLEAIIRAVREELPADFRKWEAELKELTDQ